MNSDLYVDENDGYRYLSNTTGENGYRRWPTHQSVSIPKPHLDKCLDIYILYAWKYRLWQCLEIEMELLRNGDD
jgi:hypothetical protein